jgi:hypothetical protein
MILRRTLLAALVALLLPAPTLAQDNAGPKPLIVMLEANPWLMVIGSDSPSFALYDDGTVIYATGTGYKSAKLGPDARAALIEKVKPEALAGLARHYDLAPGWSDMPTTYLFVFGSGGPKAISVYGPLQGDVQLPPPIGAAYQMLHGYRHPDATDWLPDRIEVMIWPYDYAPDKSIEWPQGWPGLKDPATVKRGEGSYSLYLPAADYPALVALLKTRKEKGAVRIDGHKWAVSFRFPFPQERSWTVLRGREPV